MLSRKITGVALFGAAAALAAVAVPALAAQPHRAPTAVVVLDCSGKAQATPGTYLVACGDGNNYVTSLHWTGWGTDAATATGTDNANDCTPNCAAGTFHQYPAALTLTKPEPWAGHPGTTRYTQLHLHYTGGRPAGLASDVTINLPSPPA